MNWDQPISNSRPSELKIRLLPPDHKGPPFPQRNNHPKATLILYIQRILFLYHKIVKWPWDVLPGNMQVVQSEILY